MDVVLTCTRSTWRSILRPFISRQVAFCFGFGWHQKVVCVFFVGVRLVSKDRSSTDSPRCGLLPKGVDQPPKFSPMKPKMSFTYKPSTYAEGLQLFVGTST